MDDFSELLRTVTDFRLFSLRDTPVTVATVLTAVLIVILARWASVALRGALRRAMAVRGVEDEGALATTQRLTHYTVMIVGFGVALETMGFDLTTLFTAGAVLAVGIGFAMQNIAQNFVSGVILLAERSITPSDVLEVDGVVVRISEMRIRATVARTRDEEELIIPNSALVQSTVKNFTLGDSHYRIRTRVGVSYASDLDQVRDVLVSAASDLEARSDRFDPVVLLYEFGDSSIVFETSVWIEDPWQHPRVRSQLNFAIWHALRDAGITIAFPQLDLHVKSPPE